MNIILYVVLMGQLIRKRLKVTFSMLYSDLINQLFFKQFLHTQKHVKDYLGLSDVPG